MRNRSFVIFLFCITFVSQVFADTTSVPIDSASKPFTPQAIGPLGIDTMTGLALYGAAILFAILILALWRKNIVSKDK